MVNKMMMMTTMKSSFSSCGLPLLALVDKGGVLGFDLSYNKLVGHLVLRL